MRRVLRHLPHLAPVGIAIMTAVGDFQLMRTLLLVGEATTYRQHLNNTFKILDAINMSLMIKYL
jgi:hypothetical protein